MNGLLYASLLLHVAACSLLTGASFLLVLAGRPKDEAAGRWERMALSASKWLALVALGAGLIWFALRAATFTGRPETALDPSAIFAAAIDTWVGKVWLIRQGLLAFAAAWLFLAGQRASRADWIASRWLVLTLSAAALMLMSLSSHAAAIERQLLVHLADILHLLSAGLWIGALPFVAALLFIANREGQVLLPYSRKALVRFSRVATVLIFALVGTGIVTACHLVGDIPGLVGTTHGRLLIAKIAVLIPALLIAARVRDMLVRPGSTPLARRIALHVAVEAALVLLILGFAIAMILSVPGKHGSPTWPFPIRYVPDPDAFPFWQALTPQQNAIALAACGLLVLGLLVCLWRWSRVLLAGVAASVVAGLFASSWNGSTVQAHPTSYARSPVSYDVRTLDRGRESWQQHCPACSIDLARLPRSATVGDLFWLIGEGNKELGIPSLAAKLDEETRWSVAQYLRASATAATVTAGGGKQIRPGLIPAPDFDIVLGPLQLGILSDYRRGRAVLLVLYSLPQSRERMEQLAKRHAQLAVHNVEIVAVPRRSFGNPIAELATTSPALFPIVTEGNGAIVRAYDLFAARAEHSEFLIDTRGYIRAIWPNDEWRNADDEIEALAQQFLDEAPPDEADEHQTH